MFCRSFVEAIQPKIDLHESSFCLLLRKSLFCCSTTQNLRIESSSFDARMWACTSIHRDCRKHFRASVSMNRFADLRVVVT